MKLIKEICHDPEISVERYKIRKAARAILINSNDEVAIISAQKHKYHKIIGGGIEFGEDILTALMREVKEEAGAEIDVIGELGLIIEWRNKHEMEQISYCYIAKVRGELCKPSFTQLEKDEGFVLNWYKLDEAVRLFENDRPSNYVAKYMLERDIAFLIEYLILKNNYPAK